MAKPDTGTNYPFLFPDQSTSFDPLAFDQLIATQGTQFVHFRAMRCPVGLIDVDDVRRPHDHHNNCSNGFNFTLAGVVTCGFIGNSKDTKVTDFGRVDGSVVQAIFPRYYDSVPNSCDTEVKIDIAPFDRMYLKEESILVVNWQTFACHISGADRLQFPAVDVVDLMDSSGKRYHQNTDFTIVNGQIHWNDNKSPGIDPKTGKGVVCSVRFHYRPYFYIRNLMHEVRVAQVEDDYGNRTTIRMPQSAMLAREFHFQSEERDPEAPASNTKNARKTGETGGPDSPRQQPGPNNSSFGPR